MRLAILTNVETEAQGSQPTPSKATELVNGRILTQNVESFLSNTEDHAAHCFIILPPSPSVASAPLTLFLSTNGVKLIDQNSFNKHQGSSKLLARRYV